MIFRVDRALAWPSSTSGTTVMAQKPHFSPKIRKCWFSDKKFDSDSTQKPTTPYDSGSATLVLTLCIKVFLQPHILQYMGAVCFFLFWTHIRKNRCDSYKNVDHVFSQIFQLWRFRLVCLCQFIILSRQLIRILTISCNLTLLRRRQQQMQWSCALQ